MDRQIEFCLDRTVESLKNKVQILQELGRKEFFDVAILLTKVSTTDFITLIDGGDNVFPSEKLFAE